MAEGIEEGSYVTDKNIEFSLANEEVFKDVSIWGEYNMRNEEIKDPDGNVYKFPIKEGELKGTDGKIRNFETLMKMPNPIFKRVYPNLVKNKRYTRSIIISGVEVYYNFTKVANDKLNEMIDAIKSQQGNPCEVVFKQTYKESNPPMSKYKIEIIGKISDAAQEPQTPVKTGDIKINVPTSTDEPKLEDKEKELIEAVKKLDTKLTIEQFNKICVDNGITDETRIKELWEIYSE